jgi:hypothetical protein
MPENSIMPEDTGMTEDVPESSNGHTEEGPPKDTEDVPWATSHFQVMMGKPLYGALLDAETDDLIAQVQKRDSTTIHKIRDREGLSGKIRYLTEGGDGEEISIEVSLKEPKETGQEEPDSEELVSQIRDEVLTHLPDRESTTGNADREDLQDEIDTLSKRLQSLRDRNQELRSRVEDRNQDLREAHNEHRTALSKLRSERETLRVEKARLEREKEDLKSRAEDAEEREQELEETVRELRDRIGRLKSQVTALDTGDDDDGGGSGGFWEQIAERVLGEDGILSELDGQSVQQVIAHLSQQRAQSQPQQVQARRAPQVQSQRSGLQSGGGQQSGRAAGGGRQPQQRAQAQRQNRAPQNSQSQQPQRTMDRDEEVAKLFKRIIGDSVKCLQGAKSEAEIQETADTVNAKLKDLRSNPGFQIQPHEWAQLLVELSSGVSRMDFGDTDPAMAFCHRLWPILLTFSDQLDLVTKFDSGMAAAWVANSYEGSSDLLLQNRVEVTEDMKSILEGVVSILKDHLGTGERPGGVPEGGRDQPEQGRGGGAGGDSIPQTGANQTPPGF